MCGIAGYADWDRDLAEQRELIENMLKTLVHRGPDAQGLWLSARAVLGHRRLSVVDPEGGSQPMLYKAGGFVYAITFNGEIYNYRELRKELTGYGHTFQTNSDTEVLLRAYIEWGDDCVRYLNGIFAFAVWDDAKQQLFLARDHLGVKPLFYASYDSGIVFGSELKALLVHPMIKAELDAEGLAELFKFSPLHTPGFGVFHAAKELRPGYKLVFNQRGTHISQYWSLKSEPHTDNLAKTTERICDLLTDIVKNQLVADVPVVSLLSGGLDSSGLTALAAEEFRRAEKQLHTYSVDFKDSEQYFVADAMRQSWDTPWVNRVSEYVGTEHHTVMIDTSDLLENLLMPMYAHDYPGLGQIETSMYLLFKAIKPKATVALSGESADEVFGGYPWYRNDELLDVPTFPWLAMRKPGGIQGSLLSPELLESIQPQAYITRRYEEALAEVPRLSGEDYPAAKRREAFYLNLTRFLPILLDRKDRTSMAAGFEVRVPFCDYRLVEYVWNIPWAFKYIDNMEKGILRRAFAEVLPEDVRNRRKSAYPASQHPEYVRGVCDWVLQILHNSNSAILPFVNTAVLEAIARGRMPAVPNNVAVNLLERIIQIDAWLKDYQVHIL